MDNGVREASGDHDLSVKDAIMICRDLGLVEQVQGAAAALQARVEVTREPEQLRRSWRGARAVFVGADSASWVAGLGLPPRSGVHLVGRRAEDVMSWSVPLEATVVVLPDQIGFVSAILDQRDSEVGGRLVRIVGASGGLGASTLAAGLAQTAARSGPSALVELARAGGGLDILMGLEREAGWRWDELVGATGHLDDLAPRLPRLGGMALVSTGRHGREPGAEAAVTVLRSLLRGHQTVVVDGGRDDLANGDPWTQARTLLVVGADVRGVLAARVLVEERGWADLEVVVRRGPGRSLPVDEVAGALSLPVVGVVGHHSGLPRALEQGAPPATSVPRFARQCRRILDGMAA